ncbi:MAG: HAD family hydrolase [Desulfatiglandales bacterium]
MLKAIGFDLFNTLMVVHPNALNVALGRLVDTLLRTGLSLPPERFLEVHNQCAVSHIKEAKATGRETHNRIWISEALKAFNYHLDPHGEIIGEAVESYFSAFYELSSVIPGTHLILGELKNRYKLALVSNFTHYPACIRILERLGLRYYFDFLLISGEFGFRKPHPSVFDMMVHNLGVRREEVIFVGDDPESDVKGALMAGIRPVWSSYVLDQRIPFTPGYVAYTVRPEEVPGYRISTWNDLKALLESLE